MSPSLIFGAGGVKSVTNFFSQFGTSVSKLLAKSHAVFEVFKSMLSANDGRLYAVPVPLHVCQGTGCEVLRASVRPK